MGVPRMGGSTALHPSYNSYTSTAVVEDNNNTIQQYTRRGEKRSWDSEDPSPSSSTTSSSSSQAPPSKVLCTSPPHALCAEDVPQQHAPDALQSSAAGSGDKCGEDHVDGKVEDPLTHLLTSTSPSPEPMGSSSPLCSPEHNSTFEGPPSSPVDPVPTSANRRAVYDDSDASSSTSSHPDYSMDEEDKDSGFIDGNSIDNSSDDDMEGRLTKEDASSSSNAGFDFLSTNEEPPRCSSVTSSLDKLSLDVFQDKLTPQDVPSSPNQPSLSRSFSLEVLGIKEENTLSNSPQSSSSLNNLSSIKSSSSSCVVSSLSSNIDVSVSTESYSSNNNGSSGVSSGTDSLVSMSEMLATSIAISVDVSNAAVETTTSTLHSLPSTSDQPSTSTYHHNHQQYHQNNHQQRSFNHNHQQQSLHPVS